MLMEGTASGGKDEQRIHMENSHQYLVFMKFT